MREKQEHRLWFGSRQVSLLDNVRQRLRLAAGESAESRQKGRGCGVGKEKSQEGNLWGR